MRQAGLTEGCGGGRVLPGLPGDARADRRASSSARSRVCSLMLSPMPSPTTTARTHEDAINRLAASGIASGCTATSYCPIGHRHPRRRWLASSLAGWTCRSPPVTGSPMTTVPSYQTNINRLAESRDHQRLWLTDASVPNTGVHARPDGGLPPPRADIVPACRRRARCSLPRTCGTSRVDDLPVATNSGTMIDDDRTGRGPASGLRRVPGLRDPDQRRRQIARPCSTVSFDYDDESDHVSVPDPTLTAHRGRRRSPHPHVGASTPAGSTSFSPPQAASVVHWHAGSGAIWDLELERAAAGWLDERRRGRSADPARARALRGGRRRARSSTPFASPPRRRATRTSTRHAITPAGTATAPAAADGPSRAA